MPEAVSCLAASMNNTKPNMGVTIMPKPIVQVRNARIVPATSVWPWRTDFDPEAMVMLGELASKHPTLGEPVGHGQDKIRTSLIVEQRLSAREVETMNTTYQLVD